MALEKKKKALSHWPFVRVAAKKKKVYFSARGTSLPHIYTSIRREEGKRKIRPVLPF